MALAAEGPAAAVAVAADALARYDVSLCSPRYAWPLLVSAAMAATRAPGEDAAALLDRLRSLAEKLDAFGPVQRAWQLSYAALDPAFVLDLEADEADDDDDGRLAVADAAVAAWEAVGQPYPGGRRAGPRRQGRPGGAGRPRGGGAAAAGRADRAAARRRAARRAGRRPHPPGRRRRGRRDPGLTSRELEVLRLVAAGQSNREIAAALVISPKTASVHVSNILAKLGAATRTEAAVKAHELGVPRPPRAEAAALTRC